MPGPDRDGDGDRDGFDAQHEVLDENPVTEALLSLGGSPRVELYQRNNEAEFWEDVFELFDGNPNNNSFTDGGNGSGNETPTPDSGMSGFPGYTPGGGLPVLLSGIDTTTDSGFFGV